MGAVVVGIDVGGTFIKAALVNRQGRILTRLKRPTGASPGKITIINDIFSIIRTFETSPISRGRISAIGLGLPGIIDLKPGVISTSPNFPNWGNFSIRKMLSQRIEIPLFLENDANAAALGEKWMGAAKDAKDFCFITLGTGVGGGLVLGGEIWHGADGMAGEVGHMTIHPNGYRCGCGNRGCLEVYASATALQRMVREARAAGRASQFFRRFKPSEIDGESIHRAAKKGDRISREAFAQVGTALGIGIANLINLLNLEKVVLGGGLSAAWRFFIPTLREEIKNRAFRAPARRVQIVRAAVGEDAGVLGAAYVAWQGLASILPASQ
jgi:glucokinase